ncbi:unnamed protein product [Cyclocybe aegerita]|uniref:F-box domain-containing protein n=1 Tax=Cyclocybe aegerita TaxID=1973307 RepID=A0A8S0XYZ5_CYCAE|nr:unnamed protein product [Cyclocybe aegerita]
MPRRSNKRVKYSLFSENSANVESTAKPNAKQTSKILEFPYELILEILSYFEALPVPFTPDDARMNSFSTHLPESTLERSDTLRALSQTCRMWRNVFLPMVWQNLEVSATHSQSAAWYKVFGEALIRKSKLVCDNPDIASLVRSYTVIISRYSPFTVLPAFVQTIEALPNCHTLQILRAHHKMSTMFKGAFEGRSFPQIRTVVLPSQAHHVLRCCPEARRVICNSYDHGSQLVSAIAKNCKKVEVIEGLHWWHGDNTIERIPRAMPKLRIIKFSSLVHPDVLKPLAKLTKLETIVFPTTAQDFDTLIQSHDHRQELAFIKSAKELSRNSKATGRKTIVVRYTQWRPTANSYVSWSKVIELNDKSLELPTSSRTLHVS